MQIRGARLPSDVRARAALARDERILSWAGDEAAGWLIATREALVIVPASQGATPTRLGWEEIERAAWDRDSASLRVTEVGTFGRTRPVHAISLNEPGQRFLDVLRERVAASVVLQEAGSTPDGRGFRIIVRRSPRDRSVRAFVEYDGGSDPQDPAVAEAVESLLRRVAWEIGAEL